MSAFPLPEATDYQSYLKPRVATLLRSVGLDKEYVRAQGDYLWYRTDEGVEHRVLDLVGGFGSTILGHNHPELVDLLSRALMDRTPVMAQGSIRTQAGYLAKTLCNLMEERTGTEWIVTLTNSGAEAIEAAVKHAMYRKSIQIDDILEQQQNTLLEILTRPDWKEHIPDAVLRLYLKCTRSELDERFSQQKLLQSYADALQQILSKDLHLVALTGGFHGKTNVALKLTHNESFRNPWTRFGIRGEFLTVNDHSVFEKHLLASTDQLPMLSTDNNSGEFLQWCSVLAVCVEPIQGEGGIRVLDQSYLQAIQQCSDSHDFPLIVDEIQSGMGRTGRFLASDHTNVYGDYLTLSKSLGGGLVKIGAMLVKKSLYIDDFGYLHSSTFADDALSAIVASHTLKVLQRDDASLIKTCESRGNYIRNRLDELHEKYPEFIGEVRGRGLMIGIEFKKPTGIQSLLAREIYDQELFGFFISGYLLNQYHIRVVPTLSSPNTLRLEPSAYIDENIDRRVGQSA